MDNINILIWTEAGPRIGLGHLSRMVVLFSELSKRKANISIGINQNEKAVEFLRQKSINCIIIESYEEIYFYCNANKINILIIDVKNIEEEQVRLIKSHTNTEKVIIVGIPKIETADLILHPGLHSEKEKAGFGPKVIDGLEVMIMDSRLREIETGKQDIILLSFGGTDKYDVLAGIIRIIFDDDVSRRLLFRIIIGPYYDRTKQIMHMLAESSINYELIFEPKDMADCMNGISGAITYYGATFYELYYARIPSLSVVTEKRYLEEFSVVKKLGIGYYGGTATNINKKAVIEYLKNYRKLKINDYKISDMDFIYNIITEGVKNV